MHEYVIHVGKRMVQNQLILSILWYNGAERKAKARPFDVDALDVRLVMLCKTRHFAGGWGAGATNLDG